MMELLFSYGTLQQVSVQVAQCGRRLQGRADALPGWCTAMVEITDHAVIEKSGKTHHPVVMPGRKDESVAGMVFEIVEQEHAAADAYEVADYKRIAALLASGVTARVYEKASRSRDSARFQNTVRSMCGGMCGRLFYLSI